MIEASNLRFQAIGGLEGREGALKWALPHLSHTHQDSGNVEKPELLTHRYWNSLR